MHSFSALMGGIAAVFNAAMASSQNALGIAQLQSKKRDLNDDKFFVSVQPPKKTLLFLPHTDTPHISHRP